MSRQSRAKSIVQAAVLAVAVACTPARPDPSPTADAGRAIDMLPLLAVEMPSDNRDGVEPPDSVIVDQWERLGDTMPARFRAELPVRPRARHFFRAPPGMSVLDESGKALPFSREAATRRTWVVSVDELVLTDRGRQPREPGPISLRDTAAQARERRLNLGFSGSADAAAFARTRIQVGDDTYEGLYLPAPAQVEVEVAVPTAGELHFTPVLVPPELRDLPPGDGAHIVVEVVQDGTSTQVWRGHIAVEGPNPKVHANLSRWAGQTVRLRLRTEAGANARYDYVLLGAPTVTPRKAAPRRVVVLFIDTLRPDRLPTYGYERTTAPWLDSVAQGGTVVEGARSVAPWTLPSARSALSGVRPDRWGRVPTLGEELRKEGWHTTFYAANMFLADRYGLSRGFGEHRMDLMASASQQVDRGIAWLDAHTDHDALLVLHFMDPHLPYTEPQPHRGTFAGPTPPKWKDRFVRNTVLALSPGTEVRRWISDRYDNNIHYVDTELKRLSAHLRPDDLIVVFSDHGEEFWEHESFEHGHSLYDEVVSVPFIFRGPRVPTARLKANASLMDLTPTVLDWAGITPDPRVVGRSLLPAANGEVTAETLDERSLPLGHPLYGFERWGVVHGRYKFHTSRGMELLQDLAADPGETQDHLQPDDRRVWHAHLTTAHDSPAVAPLRLAIQTVRSPDPQAMELSLLLPGGADQVWLGEDAMGTPGLTAIRADDGAVRVSVPAGWRGGREVYVVPAGDVTAGPTVLAMTRGDQIRPVALPVDLSTRPAADGSRLPLATHQWSDKSSVSLTWALVPRPKADGTSTSGYDPELLGALEQAGYLTPAATGGSTPPR